VSFATGALVRSRGREWVVLPASTEELVLVRPLGGTDDEETGILADLEVVEPATFDLPDPALAGDFRSSRLLRDALRLGFRSSAGPFRSFGAIAVEPRAYQLVPLMMALRQDIVRILIADDVGIGKTIEASLIVKELIAQGSAERLAVLCPPHLAEQWQSELREKFHIDAELVMPSTVSRLERGLPMNRSIFEAYPNVIVSIDYIKGDKRKADFVRACPEVVIVDEAHGCTLSTDRGHQQRYELVRALSKDEERHLILVTATPHSGKADAFRSLLGHLGPGFEDLPDDLGGRENEAQRRKLARFLVQRRRGDIKSYLDEDTPFPERDEAEATYKLNDDYRKLFNRVLAYARETVKDQQGGQHRQRVRWWAALGLLRALASSPAAAAETLRNRATTADTTTREEADEVGRRSVLDVDDDESFGGIDVTPGADVEGDEDEAGRDRRRLQDMARQADGLRGGDDPKLTAFIPLLKKMLKDGYRPIVFCRFIATAEYLGDELRKALGKDVQVAAVTGKLPPEERERRVLELAVHEKRVLVATDCLSEGINLQEHFDAVAHYDLSWNPTRHEQREGRVDRYGQQRLKVHSLTFYGVDNQIDGIVLRVLIRKSKSIRDGLGVTVPTPQDADSVMQAIAEGLLLHEDAAVGDQLALFEGYFRPKEARLHEEWDRAAEREQRSRTLFAQHTLDPTEVANELGAVREAIGSSADVERFVRQVLAASGATLQGTTPLSIDLRGTPRALRDAVGALGDGSVFSARFELPVGEDEIHLTRTSRFVEGLATHVLDTSLDNLQQGVATRCGAIRTDAVDRRTTLLLLRMRFDIVTKRASKTHTQLAEDALLLAFEGTPDDARWLAPEAAEALLAAEPVGSVPDPSGAVASVLEGFEGLSPALEDFARGRGDELLGAHERVREAARAAGVTYSIDPKLPVEVLGAYVFLPTPRT
jgi:Helicase conserved C-terminal domain/SNF2-related domain